jgi:hypothetical protein
LGEFFMVTTFAEMPVSLIDVDRMGSVTTGPLVEAMAAEQLASVRDLSLLGVSVEYDIVQSCPHPDGLQADTEGEKGATDAHHKANSSYSEQLVNYGRRIETQPNHVVMHHDRDAAAHLADTENAVMVIMPGQTLSGNEEMLGAVHTFDLDNAAGGNDLVPATAEAMKIVGEQMVREPVSRWSELGLKVGYVGYGKRTTEPLDQKILKKAGVEPVVNLDGKDMIDNIDDFTRQLQEVDIFFAAVPRARVLMTKHLAKDKPVYIVDVGQGPHPVTKKRAGSVDQNVLTLPGVMATALYQSVGKVTTALIHRRLVRPYKDAYLL